MQGQVDGDGAAGGQGNARRPPRRQAVLGDKPEKDIAGIEGHDLGRLGAPVGGEPGADTLRRGLASLQKAALAHGVGHAGEGLAVGPGEDGALGRALGEDQGPGPLDLEEELVLRLQPSQGVGGGSGLNGRPVGIVSAFGGQVRGAGPQGGGKGLVRDPAGLIHRGEIAGQDALAWKRLGEEARLEEGPRPVGVEEVHRQGGPAGGGEGGQPSDRAVRPPALESGDMIFLRPARQLAQFDSVRLRP